MKSSKKKSVQVCFESLEDRQLFSAVTFLRGGTASNPYSGVGIRATVVAPTATVVLNITVRDYAGAAVQSPVTVIVYDKNYLPLYTKQTNNNGFVQFGGIPTTSYNLEAYGPDGQFWNNKALTITASTTSFILTRDRPIATAFKMFLGNTNTEITPGSTVYSDQPVRIEITAREDTLGRQDVQAIYRMNNITTPSGIAFDGISALVDAGVPHTFVFAARTFSAGTYARRVEINNWIVSSMSHYALTDSWDYSPILNVITPVGSAAITARAQDGISPAPVGSQVVIYNNSIKRTLTVTDSTGIVGVNDLPEGNYTTELYGSKTEFWARNVLSIIRGINSSLTLVRNEPYASNFHVYDGATDVTNGSSQDGNPLRFTASLVNGSAGNRIAILRMVLTKSDGSVYKDVQQQIVISANGTGLFELAATPRPGTYSRALETYTQYIVNGQPTWVKTDSWDTGVAVRVTPMPGSISQEQLMAIMPALSNSDAGRFIDPLNSSMHEFGITTPKEQAAFLAQMAGETVQLNPDWWSEKVSSYTGPDYIEYTTSATTKSHVRRANAHRHTHIDDGLKYHGRGPLQLTWLDNYEKASMALFGDDRLVQDPSQVSDSNNPLTGFRTAAWYFTTHAIASSGLTSNQTADTVLPNDNSSIKAVNRQISIIVNGGTPPNVIDREAFFRNALGILIAS